MWRCLFFSSHRFEYLAYFCKLPSLCNSNPRSHSEHFSLLPTCLKIGDDRDALAYAGDVARPFGGILPARGDGLPKGARDEVSPATSFPVYATRSLE